MFTLGCSWTSGSAEAAVLDLWGVFPSSVQSHLPNLIFTMLFGGMSEKKAALWEGMMALLGHPRYLTAGSADLWRTCMQSRNGWQCWPSAIQRPISSAVSQGSTSLSLSKVVLTSRHKWGVNTCCGHVELPLRPSGNYQLLNLWVELITLFCVTSLHVCKYEPLAFYCFLCHLLLLALTATFQLEVITRRRTDFSLCQR